MPFERGLRLSLTFIAIGAIASVVLLARVAVDDDGAQAISATTVEPAPAVTPEWAIEVAEICERAAKRRERRARGLFEAFGGRPPRQQLEVLAATTFVPSFRKLAEDLRVVQVPDEAQREMRRMVRLFERGAAQMEADPRPVSKGDTPRGIAKAAAIARGLGIEPCVG